MSFAKITSHFMEEIHIIFLKGCIIMEEIMNIEAIENTEEESTLFVPESEEDAVLESNENSGVGTLAVGAGLCGLAVIGAVTVGRATWKHVLKPIGHKIKGVFSKDKQDNIVDTTAVVVEEMSDEDSMDEMEE